MINPQDVSHSDIRKLGLAFFVFFFGILGVALPVYNSSPLRVWAVILGASVLVLTLIVPRMFRKPYLMWLHFGGFLGKINSKILLAVVYFLIITPLGALMWLMRRDALRRKRSSTSSYRTPSTEIDPSSLERIF